MTTKDIFACTDCKIATESMNTETANSQLLILQQNINPNWRIIDNYLYIEVKFSNFNKSLNFVNKISIISNNIGHHPDIAFGWGYCNIKILTHKVNGLTETDFYLAELISREIA